MCSDVAVSVKSLSKTYRIFRHPGDRIKQALMLGRAKFHREFTALKNVSFEIKKGETVGIIGRNGSGKSTLLQLICGILKPTSGSVQVNGRVSALLELGAGFNPEFTGRENIYFHGALSGFTKVEIDALYDDIVTFADIGEFSEQPVRTYSSGMFVRLAFAVAVHVKPDILVVDEALAVGDASFQVKCFRQFDLLKTKGVTVLLVSHSVEQVVRMCDKAILLHNGEVLAYDDASSVSSQYMESLFGHTHSLSAQNFSLNKLPKFSSNDTTDCFHLRGAYNSSEYRWGDLTAQIIDFKLSCSGLEHVASIEFNQGLLLLAIKVRFLRDVNHPIYGLVIKSQEGVVLCAVNSIGRDHIASGRSAHEVVIVKFSLSPHLAPGEYFLSLGVTDEQGAQLVVLDRRYDSIHLSITGQINQAGIVDMNPVLDLIDADSGIIRDEAN